MKGIPLINHQQEHLLIVKIYTHAKVQAFYWNRHFKKLD